MEIVIWCAFFGLIGLCAARVRGWSPVVGFIAGAVLGPLALLLFAVSGVVASPKADPMKVCGQCAESVRPDAKVCRYCGHKFAW